MDFERTGVMLEEKDLKKVVKAYNEARHTPVIMLTSGMESMAQTAMKAANRLLYEKALALGLPEIEGYYGVDPSNGEVLAPPGQMKK